MTVDIYLASRRYLAPAEGAFWRWSADREAVEWLDSGTIAFRAEITEVLRQLAPTGLPPFDAVVLLLAMTRGDWPLRLSDVLGESADAVAAEVPQKMRSTSRRPELVELVLGGKSQTTPEFGDAVVRALDTGLPPDALEPRAGEAMSASTCLGLMHEPLTRLTPERIEMRNRTGLDEPVAPADVELPSAERARRLLSDLDQDPKLGGFAAFTRDLMAAVHVPRPVSEPEDLPLGGVSEITNRGPLDRLLVSELAHDDETLMLRIATGEALYMRREAPPQTPGGARDVLVDCGIRQWGLPRVFAAAVALAIAAKADRDLDVRGFRTTSGDVAPVDLLQREGLIELLEALEPAPHPASSMQPFVDRCRHEGEPADAVLVTHEDVLDDPEFLSAWDSKDEIPFYVATVNASGRFALWSMGGRSKKPIGHAQLNLAKLLTTTDLTPARDELPVILSIDPFPLRMPFEWKGRRASWSEAGGVLSATRDGRLLHAPDAGKGARQITTALPRGDPRFVDRCAEGRAAVVIDPGEGRNLELCAVDLMTGDITRNPIDCPDVLRFRISGGALIIERYGLLSAFDPETGEVLAEREVSGGVTGHLSFDGSAIHDDAPPPSRTFYVPSGFRRAPSMYRKLTGVAFDVGGLRIVTRKQKALKFRKFYGGVELTEVPRLGATGARFHGSVRPPECGFRIYSTTSPSGKRVSFDTRGLLHLTSAKTDEPELTIVLCSHKPVAAWSSDGRTFGNEYFFESSPEGTDDELFGRILSFAESS